MYRVSSGWTATATSPSIVSRRVVATAKNSSSLPLTAYLKVTMTPTSTLSLVPGMGIRVRFVTSSCSTSRSDSAVRRCDDQLTRRTSLNIFPCSKKRQNASVTATESWESIVKNSRDQSNDDAKRVACWQMWDPFSSFHSQTRPKKASRPMSWRVFPSVLYSSFSTTDWVAIPAWSVPGTHRVWWPFMRCQRAMQSSTDMVSA